MTLDEAKAIGAIVETADGGCCYCVRDLVGQLQRRFPEFAWRYEKDYDPLVVELADPPKP